MKKVTIYIIAAWFIVLAGNLCAETRPMIILIDSEQEQLVRDLSGTQCQLNTVGSGPITDQLMAALVQKVSPIMVSGSVWRNFIERRKLFLDLTTNYDAHTYSYYQQRYACFQNQTQFNVIRQLLNDAKNSTDIYPVRSVKAFYIPGSVPFDPSEWVMKKLTTSGSLFLLIPIEHKNSFSEGLNVSSFSTVNNMLDVDAFPKGGSDQQEKIVTKTVKKVPGDFQEHIVEEIKNKVDIEIIPTLKKLFIIKPASERIGDIRVWGEEGSKQPTATEKNNYEWLVFLNGHGSPPAQGPLRKAVIAGLSEETFTKVLDFFNNEVTTKFLVYITCFSGGKHLFTPYEKSPYFPAISTGQKEREAARAQLFNYTIATTNIFEISSTSGALSLGKRQNKIFIMYPIKFNIFFEQLKVYYQDPIKAEPLGNIMWEVSGLADFPVTDSEFSPETLDTYLGNKTSTIFYTPLYYDVLLKKRYIKKGQQKIYVDPYTFLYTDDTYVYIDATKGSRGGYFSHEGEDVFLGEQATQRAQLAIESGTGGVYLNKKDGKYYFTWKTPKIVDLQIPTIRFPGTGWFSVVDLDGKVQRVTRVQALTSQANNKPIVSQGKQVVIFDTQSPLIRRKNETEEHAAVGTFEIKKQGKQEAPEIMLFAAEDAKMYFESVSTDYDFMAILHACIPLSYYPYTRTFYIKKLVCAGKTYSDVIILSSAPLPGAHKDSARYNGVFYTLGGNKFSGVWPVNDANAYMLLAQKKQITNLNPDNYAFNYPYPNDLTEYKGIAAVSEILKQKKTKGPLKETLSTSQSTTEQEGDTPTTSPTPQGTQTGTSQQKPPAQTGASTQPQGQMPPKSQQQTQTTSPVQPQSPPPVVSQNPLEQKLQALTDALKQLRSALLGN
jgi:hypothetical protein